MNPYYMSKGAPKRTRNGLVVIAVALAILAVVVLAFGFTKRSVQVRPIAAPCRQDAEGNLVCGDIEGHTVRRYVFDEDIRVLACVAAILIVGAVVYCFVRLNRAARSWIAVYADRIEGRTYPWHCLSERTVRIPMRDVLSVTASSDAASFTSITVQTKTGMRIRFDCAEPSRAQTIIMSHAN